MFACSRVCVSVCVCIEWVVDEKNVTGPVNYITLLYFNSRRVVVSVLLKENQMKSVHTHICITRTCMALS